MNCVTSLFDQIKSLDADEDSQYIDGYCNEKLRDKSD